MNWLPFCVLCHVPSLHHIFHQGFGHRLLVAQELFPLGWMVQTEKDKCFVWSWRPDSSTGTGKWNFIHSLICSSSFCCPFCHRPLCKPDTCSPPWPLLVPLSWGCVRHCLMLAPSACQKNNVKSPPTLTTMQSTWCSWLRPGSPRGWGKDRWPGSFAFFLCV